MRWEVIDVASRDRKEGPTQILFCFPRKIRCTYKPCSLFLPLPVFSSRARETSYCRKKEIGKMMRNLCVLLAVNLVNAFAPPSQRLRPRTMHWVVAPNLEDVQSARTAFFFWFFGASGSAGLARSAFPRMYKNFRETQSLAGQGPTLGGETLGLSPLVGYPEDLKVQDVEQIINNPLTVEDIVIKFPIENNFLSQNGYLTYPAFKQANQDANPLAVRAIFDTFNTSTDVVSRDKAQEILDSYKQDISKVKSNLLTCKLVGYLAIVTLLFLLGLADVIAAGHAYHGWFPGWPGGRNFPWGIFGEETGLWTIPRYWI